MGKKLAGAGLGAALALAAFASAQARETGYVAGYSVNCREEGWSSSKIVKVLHRGDRAAVVDRVSGWANLDFGDEACWVLAKYVGSQTLANTTGTHSVKSTRAQASRAKDRPKAGSFRAVAASSPARRPARRSSRASSGYSAAGCPCSGSRVCVGPRGGRYCITSGGNKRYGV